MKLAACPLVNKWLAVFNQGVTPSRAMITSLFIQMTDANQVWDVKESVEWMKYLSEIKPLWIEEPTSPDDVLGHAEISKVKPNIHYL